MFVNKVNSDATASRADLLTHGMPIMPVSFCLNGVPKEGCMVLRAEGLAAFRAERLVLRQVDFVVGAGDALVLLGPNGSGKSTLLRLLAGLKRPDAGTISWDGEDIATDPGAHAARVAYVGHLDAVKPGLTAAENLACDARLGGGSTQAALAALDLAPLAALPARMLSAGQRRRLALARTRADPGALVASG